jgi:hypothetical protein
VIADAIIIGLSSFLFDTTPRAHCVHVYPPFAALHDALVSLSSPTVICGIAQYLRSGNEHLYLSIAATDLS